MAFQEVTDLSADVTVSLGGINKKTNKPNPTKVEGYYLGSKKVEDRKKKSGFSYIYFLQTPKGNLGVWGKTDLDRKMLSVTPGHMVCITQEGSVPTPNGDMYKFKVQFDPDNTIEVVSQSSADVQPEGYVDEEEDDDQGEEEDTYAQQERPSVGQLSALERKAKVEEMLKKRKV